MGQNKSKACRVQRPGLNHHTSNWKELKEPVELDVSHFNELDWFIQWVTENKLVFDKFAAMKMKGFISIAAKLCIFSVVRNYLQA